MCGLVGFFEPNNRDYDKTIRSMAKAISHRGPDADAYWIEQDKGLVFGHRRLSIIDLSECGIQPMHSSSGRYTIIYNGEVYNYKPIKDELEQLGAKFRGHSDTEVMLESFEQWGVTKSLSKFNGMFAFALWDSKEEILHLSRDRLGIKPMYYGWQKKAFLFGSELKAFRKHPEFQGEIDTSSLALFFRHNYIPAPYSIYNGIYKLPAGTLLSIPYKSLHYRDTDQHQPKAFWSLKSTFMDAQPLKLTNEQLLVELKSLLSDSVRLRMIADVPVGAFLSGGIDSSTVVALMQEHTSRAKTFSIGFLEEGFNEANYAKQVASILGTDHTELYVTPEEAQSVIPRLPEVYDEPFSDSSQIPTYLVSELTRKHVTVSLSGDGGDELFAGYSRYYAAEKIWNSVKFLPSPIRKIVGTLITTLPPSAWDRVFNVGKSFTPSFLSFHYPGEKTHRMAQLIQQTNFPEFYRKLISHWEPESILTKKISEPKTVYNSNLELLSSLSHQKLMSYTDAAQYLPDDLLTKVDRASMAHSLEARVPLLDHRVVEFSATVSQSFKYRENKSKWPLRKILYEYLPRELVDRPKMGFSVPVDQWLRGPLKEWASDLLSENEIKKHNLINFDLVDRKWQEHLSAKRNWMYYLWDVLMFQAWLKKI